VNGTVKAFIPEKRYGFISVSGAPDYFFSSACVIGEPVRRGDQVAFEIEDDLTIPGKLRAVNVEKIEAGGGDDPREPNATGALFIANLPFSLSENEVDGIFGEYGQIESCKIIRNNESGESKGYGFVRFTEPQSAAAAIEALHGRELRGRNLVVKHSQPRQR
jgi:RNA recognition motif-containing protein